MKILNYPLHEKLTNILDTREVNNLERGFYTKGVTLVDHRVKIRFHEQVMQPLNNELYFQLLFQLETDLNENT